MRQSQPAGMVPACPALTQRSPWIRFREGGATYVEPDERPNEEGFRLQEARRGLQNTSEGAKSPEHREMLLNMAATWEALAVAREKKLAQDGLTEEG
jgi:hypothetical protein